MDEKFCLWSWIDPFFKVQRLRHSPFVVKFPYFLYCFDHIKEMFIRCEHKFRTIKISNNILPFYVLNIVGAISHEMIDIPIWVILFIGVHSLFKYLLEFIVLRIFFACIQNIKYEFINPFLVFALLFCHHH